MLTAKSVKTLPAPPKGQRDYWDGGALPGLSLRVSASGERRYSLVYRVQDSRQQRRVTLGDVNLISLADARLKARKLLRQVSLGEDPMASRDASDFASICDRFKVEFCAQAGRSVTVRKVWPALIKLYVIPALGRLKPEDRSFRRKVVEFTDAIHQAGTPYAANRVFEITRRIWTWAVEKSVITPETPYPFLRLKKPFRETPRKRFYRTEEIRRLWAAIEMESAAPEGGVSEGYFKMVWYTAARRGEVARMRLDDIDFVKRQWTLSTTKNDEPLVLPLPRQALAIIEDLRPLAEARQTPYVFFSVRPDATKGHVDTTSGAPTRRIRTRSGVADFRIHDIRRTVRTNLAELRVRHEVIEAILNHVQDKMTETYNRHRYQDEMGEALQRWADRLDFIVRGGQGAEIIPLASA